MITSVRLKTFSVRICRKDRLILCVVFTIASGVLELITRSGVSLRVIEPLSTDVSIN
jgi:hypothetical protein